MSSRWFSKRREPASERCLDIEVEEDEDDDRALEIERERVYHDRREARGHTKYGQQQAYLSSRAELERQDPKIDNADKYGQQIYPRGISAAPKGQLQPPISRPSHREGHSRFETASSRNRAQSRDEPGGSVPSAPQEYCRRHRLASESQERVHRRNIGGYDEWLARREKIRRASQAEPLGEPIDDHIMSTKYQAVDERFNRFLPTEAFSLSKGEFEGIVNWVNGENYHPWEEKPSKSNDRRVK
ncbi:uncharacterized protein BP5553_00989 [Venustampulla echinocandica]|uniref:Uncharacterized protein n=1 Tax=Venustampulla echinocandica TaxID=2656787 RepID=A0A370TZT2_9HELO|nr:uncharacterized protein BP5553_00989 [Venustampulla echinocandica]RDL41010.1 hypothetical protein BP5553_00989 [Venustampulla echinocandica]